MVVPGQQHQTSHLHVQQALCASGCCMSSDSAWPAYLDAALLVPGAVPVPHKHKHFGLRHLWCFYCLQELICQSLVQALPSARAGPQAVSM
jgi:hypothetical protein